MSECYKIVELSPIGGWVVEVTHELEDVQIPVYAKCYDITSEGELTGERAITTMPGFFIKAQRCHKCKQLFWEGE